VTGLDHRLQQWVVGHRAGPLTPLLEAATWLGTWGAVWLAAGLAVALLRSRWCVLLSAALAVALGEIVSDVLKLLFARQRPVADPAGHAALVGLPHSHSFPSGHATIAFAGATVLTLALPRSAALFFVLATAIAFSRVYLGVHYPADVVAGALLGCPLGLAAWRSAPLLARPFARTRHRSQTT